MKDDYKLMMIDTKKSSGWQNIGYLSFYDSFDLEVSENGDANDFVLTLNFKDYQKQPIEIGQIVFVPNTEYGGFVREMEVDTEAQQIKLLGKTWRGLLAEKYIMVPSGQDYVTFTGDIADAIRQLIIAPYEFDTLFYEQDPVSVTVTGYEFTKNCTVLFGMTELFESVGYKVGVVFDDEHFAINVFPTPIVDYSEEEEYSQDRNVNFFIRTKFNVNHLIALGKNDLSLRVDWYLQQSGLIDNGPSTYKREEEIQEILELPSTQTVKDLTKESLAEYKDRLEKTKIQISTDDLRAEIGDIVGARERITGIYAKTKIIGKILRIQKNNVTIEMKAKEI